MAKRKTTKPTTSRASQTRQRSAPRSLAGKTKPLDPLRNGPTFYAQRLVPPNIQLSTDEQLSLSAVFACVRVISEALAGSPWEVYQQSGTKRELLPDDPIGWILNVRPNPDMPAQSFREALVIQALVYGNAFAEIVRDQLGRIVELRIIPSYVGAAEGWNGAANRVDVRRALGGEPISSNPPRLAVPGELLYYVRGAQAEGALILGQEQVFHLRSLASVDGLLGDSIVGRAAKAIAGAHAAEQFSLSYFGNNGQVGAVIKVPRQLKPEEEASMLAAWDSAHAGARKAFKPFLTAPGVEVVQSEVNAEQAQLIPVRNFSVEEVTRFFGVPLHLVSVGLASQGYGRNLDVLELAFVRHTLRPWAQRLKQEADIKLFPDQPARRSTRKFTEIDLTWLGQGDAKTQNEANEILFRNGIISKNEWRDELNRNDIPDGDRYDGKPAEAPEPADQADPQAEETDGSSVDAGASDSGDMMEGSQQ